MDGGDRAGYKQIARNVDCTLITSTMGAVTGSWAGFEVISSQAAISAIVAPSMTNYAKLTSGKALPQGAYVGAALITSIKLSTKSTGHKVIAYKRVLI